MASDQRNDLCGVTACPYEAAVGRIENHMDRTDAKLDEIGKSVASIEAGALRDRWWQQAGMWFVGILLAVVGLVVTIVKVGASGR